ncbi:MAG: hypothetical protein GYB42_00310 [Alphaproteobacteria bacterium]|nr:hypothetical protein [Alphaproteobacteria bacterium]
MTDFRFNDELLISQVDQDLAKRRFPRIFFALDHPTLREDFTRIDRLANRAKARSRFIGLCALILATVSLLAFPLEPLIKAIWLEADQARSIFRIMALIGASCGLLAILFGNFGVWFGKSKRKWLQYRLMTERLRQWHSQHLISHAAEIVEAAKAPEKIADFNMARELAYGRFQRSFLGQIASEYTKFTLRTAAGHSGQTVINPTGYRSFWIDPEWQAKAGATVAKADKLILDEINAAYEETRILGQMQYTNYILSSEGKFWSLPAKQAMFLRNATFGLVMFAFSANFVALLSAIWPQFPIGQSVLGSIAISFAILAVGVRAVEEGLRPQREIRRMEFYAASVQHARDNFAAARSQAKKVEAASGLERASFEEMIEFLSTNERARFVL